jgi:hypothetical protein
MTITKRNKTHRQLAATYARLTRYLGKPGEIPGEIETHDEYSTRTRSEYAHALTLGVPMLRRTIEAARAMISCCPHRIGVAG